MSEEQDRRPGNRTGTIVLLAGGLLIGIGDVAYAIDLNAGVASWSVGAVFICIGLGWWARRQLAALGRALRGELPAPRTRHGTHVPSAHI